MIIQAQKLTPKAFVDFGQVLMGPGSGPERYNFVASFENHRKTAKPNLSFMRVAPTTQPVEVQILERHVYSNQAFIPMNDTCQLVAVCPRGFEGNPVVENMMAFVATPSQAVNYNAGTWHAPRTVIKGAGEFVMFRWDDGSDLDTEFLTLDTPVKICINPDFYNQR